MIGKYYVFSIEGESFVQKSNSMDSLEDAKRFIRVDREVGNNDTQAIFKLEHYDYVEPED